MTVDRSTAEHLFAGKGEMAMRMRSHDWSQTTLGAVETWTQSLRSTLSICLNSRFPIAIYWGQESLLLYNDAWRPIVGDKHPWALGRPAREVWSEIWDDIGPELAGVLATGEGTFHNDELLSMHRFGYTEECFFEYTFNPIQGQGGMIDGVFNVVSETTYRVLNDRRARLLREVAAKTGTAKTAEELCALAVEAFKSDPFDVPFAFLYLIDQDGKQARLCGSTDAPDSSIIPAVVDLAANDIDGWAIAQAARTGKSQAINDLESRFGKLPGSPWSEPPQSAMVLPIAATGQGKVTGVLVVVASPRRRLDDNYRDFFDQVAGQMATALANVRAYEEERQRAEALAELDRAKTVFFSNISHEFRTPLTLMLSPLEELANTLDERLQPNEREQLQLVQRNGLRLQKLVNTLLDFSRIEAGRVQAMYEPTDLAAFTSDLASVFRSLIEQAGLQLRVECPALPELVYVDRDMWEKIVLNLMSNAFKFTFIGSITVTLQAIADRVELQVADTGVGIAPEELPRLFERFHRVNGAKSRTYEGSGIGLALVQELVKLHGGSIRVTSVLDRGTTFTVEIPLGSAHLPSEQIQTPRTLQSTALGTAPFVEEASRWLSTESSEFSVLSSELNTESSIQNSKFKTQNSPSARILLADDNADMREYVTRLLSPYYEVEAVSDGIAAWKAIQERAVDLVLTDVMMPRLDGFGLLRQLREHPQTQEISIILLSARAGEEARIEGLAAGADDYLIKPFSAQELLAKVEATLKLAQLRREAMQREQVLRLEAETAQQKVETILSSISDAFVVLDRDWNFTYVNDRYCEIVDMEQEALLGKNVWELFADAAGSEAHIQFQQALREQISVQFEWLFPAWNRWFEYRVYPSPDGLTIFLSEITDAKHREAERKQAEEQLRQREAELKEAQRIGKIGSWYWDAKTDITTGSDQLLRIYGFDPKRDTMPNFAAQDGWLYPHASWQRINTAVQQALKTGVGYELDVQAFCNGTPIWITTRCEVVRDSDSTIVGLRGTVQDITARKQAEEKLSESEERLQMLLAREQAARESAETANRVKDEFLAVLSHELRSPLNPILGWSKLLQQGNLDAAKTANALATIVRNAQLQAQLIDDLLDISRILRGKLSLNQMPVDLNLVIASALETVRLAAEAKSLYIETTVPPNISTVMGDAGRLQQVVWNLLSNAVKFTPPGGQITIALTQCATHAQIQVRDTGKGINPDFLPYVFEHFRQEDAATTRKFGGLGLGLRANS
ncbi:MAG: ATP-binding protein [Fischerella sp. CENA71]|nr:ATP-binding protein [Fischerella sp. CENA71]